MALALEVRTEHGELLGMCTAKCYAASPNDTRCVCVCRGRNHAVGELVAMARARRIAETWKDVAVTKVHPTADQLVIPVILDDEA